MNSERKTNRANKITQIVIVIGDNLVHSFVCWQIFTAWLLLHFLYFEVGVQLASFIVETCLVWWNIKTNCKFWSKHLSVGLLLYGDFEDITPLETEVDQVWTQRELMYQLFVLERHISSRLQIYFNVFKSSKIYSFYNETHKCQFSHEYFNFSAAYPLPIQLDIILLRSCLENSNK